MRGSITLVLALILSLPAVAEIKRTLDGKPDLSGVYDTGTVTPLNRPREFGDHQFMTREQANKVVEARLSRYQLKEGESDPERGAPKKGGDGINTAGAGGVGGYNAFWIDPGARAVEIDGRFRTSIVYEPANGRLPKMTQRGVAHATKNAGGFRHQNDGTASWLAESGPGPFDGPESLAPSERCLLSCCRASTTTSSALFKPMTTS